jgi:anaerobic dimethyl sulfoxide reductase subunit A
LGLLNVVISESLYGAEFLVSNTNAPFLVREDNGRVLRERDVRSASTDRPLVYDVHTSSLVPRQEASRPALSWRQTVDVGRPVPCRTVFELVRELVARHPPAETSKITGVSQGDLIALAREYATSKPSAVRVGYGIDRWYYSDLSARAISFLPIFCSYIGVPGGGISVHSGTYTLRLNQRQFRQPGGLNQNLMDLPRMMTAITTGQPYPIKALWLTCSNLFNQPAANRARIMSEVIPGLEFIVVVDQFMTATAEQADVVLPAASIFERLDLVASLYLQLQQEAVTPEGEAKSDFKIFKMLAEKMGFGKDFGKSEEEYIDEILDTDDPLLQGITLERLKREGAVLPNRPVEPYVSFVDRQFNTPSGTIELYKEELLEHGAELPYYHEPIEASPTNPSISRYPLNILFSHSRFRIHSTYANLPSLKRGKESSPTVEIGPSDAAARGLQDGDMVKVYNDRGRVRLRCTINKDLYPGVVVIPEGTWVKDFVEGNPYELTHDKVSPTSDNYAYYDCLVQIEKAQSG